MKKYDNTVAKYENKAYMEFLKLKLSDHKISDKQRNQFSKTLDRVQYKESIRKKLELQRKIKSIKSIFTKLF